MPAKIILRRLSNICGDSAAAKSGTGSASILTTAGILAIAANPDCLIVVIDPPESRPTVIRNQRLEMPQNKCDTLPLKHGNILL